MSDSRYSRRTLIGGSTGAAIAVALTRVVPAAAQGSPEAGASPVADGTFPVSISHIYGETTFESAPSPLSIPYIIETSAPKPAAAADKVPAA